MAKSTEKKMSAKTDKGGVAPLLKIDDPVYNQYGQAFYETETGKVEFNQTSLVRKFVADEQIGIEQTKEMALKYLPTTGAWEPLTSSGVKLMLSGAVRGTAQRYKQNHLPLKTKPSLLNSLEHMTKVVAPVVNARPPESMVLVKNGVLDLTNKPVLKEFNPDFGFSAASSLAYKPKAKCPRFIKELLETALPDDDVSLVQRYFGSVLIGPSASHRILLLKGTAGGGKSTLVSVLERD